MQEQTELELTITKWQKEVNIESILLIENGYSPREADDIARQIVSVRRRKAHADKSGG